MAASAAPAQLRAEKALAVGVITNELVTNAFKYAFEGERPGHVKVDLTEAATIWFCQCVITGWVIRQRDEWDLALALSPSSLGSSAARRLGKPGHREGARQLFAFLKTMSLGT